MADKVLQDREKSFEEKFRLEEELRFKTQSRRDKLLGLWLAERLGLAVAEREAYAASVVESDLAKPGDDDVIAKVMADVSGRGIHLTEAEIRAKLAEFAIVAKSQVFDGK